MPSFRTHQEMAKVYDKLENHPGRGHPYCITLHSPNRYFGFIGTSHTPDPDHLQWKSFFEEWQLFLASENNDKIVFHEGKDIFYVYGSAHSIVLEPAIKDIIDKTEATLNEV